MVPAEKVVTPEDYFIALKKNFFLSHALITMRACLLSFLRSEDSLEDFYFWKERA